MFKVCSVSAIESDSDFIGFAVKIDYHYRINFIVKIVKIRIASSTETEHTLDIQSTMENPILEAEFSNSTSSAVNTARKNRGKSADHQLIQIEFLKRLDTTFFAVYDRADQMGRYWVKKVFKTPGQIRMFSGIVAGSQILIR